MSGATYLDGLLKAQEMVDRWRASAPLNGAIREILHCFVEDLEAEIRKVRSERDDPKVGHV